MNQFDLLQRFEKIRTWKRKNQRAPHKPLLLLLALGWYSRKGQRMIPYEYIDRELRVLLEEFGTYSKSYHPEYPFWRLQKDGIWDLSTSTGLTLTSSGDAKRNELLTFQIAGGFSQDIYSRLRQDNDLISHIATQILFEHFPPSLHDIILERVNFHHHSRFKEVDSYEFVRRKKRDRRFRGKILDAYENQCAVCGFDVKIGQLSIALEAAHIQWDSHWGPDIIQNGISLCVMHHKLFDVGAWSLSDEGSILISPFIKGKVGLEEWLLRFKGSRLLIPINSLHEPSSEYKSWHRKQVFKSKS